ncbi:LacI family DNA-binding transcriptional regulator [Polycladidibacter hongkongensis]|uniref:LacI family DNA-binding transcriptional regulator n=1 Tax=Polycladidibacter hongkongensis TaxID=1647556 RepID=UPI000A59BEBA|nr:LacI family DNA-binding transcriptional regulator [Pseudovibrio hongkongensis]
MPNSKKITVADIARQAGVSVATVSNAINNTGRMSEQTRERVQTAMKELGFVRNYSAAKLRSGRSHLVGVLVQDLSNPLYSEFASALEAELSAHGYMPILANIGEDLERQDQLLGELIGHGVAGVVVTPVARSVATQFDAIVQRQLPCITMMREVEGLAADFIGIDDFHGGYLVGEHLVQLGHHRFAMIAGLEGTTTARLRGAGFLAALSEAGIPAEQVVSLHSEPTREGGELTARKLLQQDLGFSALFCHNDIMAIGASVALRDIAGIGARKIALAGFDNLEVSAMWQPSLTTVETSAQALGKDVGALLIARLNGETGVPVRRRRKPKLVVRDSTFALREETL